MCEACTSDAIAHEHRGLLNCQRSRHRRADSRHMLQDCKRSGNVTGGVVTACASLVVLLSSGLLCIISAGWPGSEVIRCCGPFLSLRVCLLPAVWNEQAAA